MAVNVRFCESCKSLILADFRYCPYCGQSVARGPGLAEALAGPFARIEGAEAAKGRGEGRFALLAERLDRLESEMDLLLQEQGDGKPSSP
jgi:hypothetical protein